MRSTLAVCVFLAAAGGCAGNPEPVLLGGSPAAIRELQGEWLGEYGSRDSGRSGSILFLIDAGSDVAHGDVVMTPSQPSGRGSAQTPGLVDAVVLRIAFVEVGTRRVRGQLAEYTDPACGCRVTTTFAGTVSGNTITGTFTTVHQADGRVQQGTWRVTRR